MQNRSHSIFVPLCAIIALSGCARDSGPAPLLGTLEWDRIAVPAEVSEPITQILVKEGDNVAADQLLLTLDPRRTQAQARCGAGRCAAPQLPRSTNCATARASKRSTPRAPRLRARRRPRRTRKLARDRAAEVRRNGLNSQADLDNAERSAAPGQCRRESGAGESRRIAARHAAGRSGAGRSVTGAGTGNAGAIAGHAAAPERARTARGTRRHLAVQARRPARSRCERGQPAGRRRAVCARVRARTQAREPAPGRAFQRQVDGVAQAFTATAVRIASEASFTPYYALSGDDASRLAWRAELALDATRTPAICPRAFPVGQRRWRPGARGPVMSAQTGRIPPAANLPMQAGEPTMQSSRAA